ncbi:hypothetical protein ACTXT7_015916 [Hymenolepis weldensis]
MLRLRGNNFHHPTAWDLSVQAVLKGNLDAARYQRTYPQTVVHCDCFVVEKVDEMLSPVGAYGAKLESFIIEKTKSEMINEDETLNIRYRSKMGAKQKFESGKIFGN